MTIGEALRALEEHLDDAGVFDYGGFFGRSASMISYDGIECAEDGQWQTRLRIDYEYDYKPDVAAQHDDAHKTVVAVGNAIGFQLKAVDGPSNRTDNKHGSMSFYVLYTG